MERLFDFERLPGAPRVRYFRPEEFDDHTTGTGGEQADEELVRRLDIARSIAMVPFVIESAYRTPEHNREVGGAILSAHVMNKAADIKVLNPEHRYRILFALKDAGFTRFEMKLWDIHVDVAHDALHPQNILLMKDYRTGRLV